MATKHPGFKAVRSSIAKKRNPKTGKPYGKKAAGAILAAKSRNASKSAKKKNPKLNKVK